MILFALAQVVSRSVWAYGSGVGDACPRLLSPGIPTIRGECDSEYLER